MAKLNEHGVYTDFEEVTIIADGRLRLMVRLAEDDGCWYFGVDYDYHNAGGGGYPSKHSRDCYGNREDALEAGRQELIGHLNNAIKGGFENPGTAGYNEVRKGLAALTASRQLRLF